MSPTINCLKRRAACVSALMKDDNRLHDSHIKPRKAQKLTPHDILCPPVRPTSTWYKHKKKNTRKAPRVQNTPSSAKQETYTHGRAARLSTMRVGRGGGGGEYQSYNSTVYVPNRFLHPPPAYFVIFANRDSSVDACSFFSGNSCATDIPFFFYLRLSPPRIVTS